MDLIGRKLWLYGPSEKKKKVTLRDNLSILQLVSYIYDWSTFISLQTATRNNKLWLAKLKNQMQSVIKNSWAWISIPRRGCPRPDMDIISPKTKIMSTPGVDIHAGRCISRGVDIHTQEFFIPDCNMSSFLKFMFLPLLMFH